MQMHLHLLDSSRDRALMNKSDNILRCECAIPGYWYTAVPNGGLAIDPVSTRLTSNITTPLEFKTGLTRLVAQAKDCPALAYSNGHGSNGATNNGASSNGAVS